MKISGKKLNITLLVVTFSVLLFIYSIFHHAVLLISIPNAIWAIFLYNKNCRCAYCGTWENLDRLIHAKNHVHHCRGCGRIIEIDKNG